MLIFIAVTFISSTFFSFTEHLVTIQSNGFNTSRTKTYAVQGNHRLNFTPKNNTGKCFFIHLNSFLNYILFLSNPERFLIATNQNFCSPGEDSSPPTSPWSCSPFLIHSRLFSRLLGRFKLSNRKGTKQPVIRAPQQSTYQPVSRKLVSFVYICVRVCIHQQACTNGKNLHLAECTNVTKNQYFSRTS